MQLVIVKVVGKSPTHYTNILRHSAVADVGRPLRDCAANEVIYIMK